MEAVSILILFTAYAVLLAISDAMEAAMEAAYKRNHNKRRRYW